MSDQLASVCVLGGGVSGLSTAICLAQNGHEVTVRTGRRSSETTSAVAAAFWYPYAVKGYRRHWAAIGYHQFRSLVGDPGSGVDIVPGIEYLDVRDDREVGDLLDSFWWRSLPGVDFEELGPDEALEVDFGGKGLGLRRFTAGATFRVPAIDMGVYLPYLESWFEGRLGGRIEVGHWFEDLDRACGEVAEEILVNCAGYAAAALVHRREPSEEVRPIGGQVVRVNAPGVRRLVFIQTGDFANEPLYIVPLPGEGRDVILGGTLDDRGSFPGRDPLPPPDAGVTEEIIRRCLLVDPTLAGRPSLGSRVGLRPYRKGVRVEPDARYPKPVVHNYGHGGAGVTLSWGCASRVADLVRDL